MEQLFFLCPASQTDYLYLLNQVSQRLDDAGISFHICRPGEDIAETVIQCHCKEVNK